MANFVQILSLKFLINIKTLMILISINSLVLKFFVEIL